MDSMRRSVALSMAIAVLSLARAPSAQTAKIDPEVAKHFALGNDLYGEQKYGDALVEYDAAYDQSHNWKILFNRGQCLVMLKREPEAIESFQRYLADGGALVSDERRKQVETDIAKLKDRLGGILIVGAPDGSVIELDGRIVATIPLARPISAGAGVHEVTARPPGGIPSIKKVTVIAGKEVSLQVDVVAGTGGIGPGPGTGNGTGTGTGPGTGNGTGTGTGTGPGTGIGDVTPQPPAFSRPTTGLISPSFMLTLGLGGVAPANDTGRSSNNRVLGGVDIGASWRINSFWELGLFGAFAGGRYELPAGSGTTNVPYSYGNYGLRFRMHPVRGRKFDGWLGFDVGRFSETWQSTATTNEFKANATALGLGFGVDFPLGRTWALGGGLRFLAASKPTCTENVCPTELPETRGFVEFGLRLVWSIPYGQPKEAAPTTTATTGPR
jgi:hypothetical protein